MTILVLHDDDVGRAVADRLRTLRQDVLAVRVGGWPAPADLAELVAFTDQVVFAWSGPVQRLESAVDRAVLLRQSVLLPVVAEGMLLRVGPLLTPDTPATVDCYYRRRRQRAGAHSHLGAVHGNFDDNPVAEPAGHLTSAITVATALANRALRSAAGADHAKVVLIEPHTGFSTSSVLLGVHGNARSTEACAPDQRTFAHLRGVVLDAMRTPTVEVTG